jgi:hypothetical protein
MLVADVRCDELAQLLERRYRRGEPVVDEEYPGLAHQEARSGAFGLERFDVCEVVAPDLDETPLGEAPQRVDDSRATDIEPTPRSGVAGIRVPRVGWPAVVECILCVDDDRPDRRPRPVFVPGVLDRRLVGRRVPEH